MKGKRILHFFIVLVILAFIVYFISPYYVRRALVYMKPGIDDYKIFQNRKIPAGKPQPWNLSSHYNTIRLSADDEKFFEKFKTIAFLIIQNDSLIYEKYSDGYSDSSFSNSFSVAKSIVGLLIGCAIDEGKIHSIDEPVSDFLPQFKRTASDKKLTIRHLLTMSSGLNWDEKYASLFSKTTEAYFGNDLKKLIGKLDVVETPGRIHRYLSCNTQILAFIIEKATGKKLSEYASEKLWRPLGAEHPAIWSLDSKEGEEKAYCCFNTNARDFARIGQLIINKGKWNGTRIVSEKYISESISPDTFLKDIKGLKVKHYGYQWWMIEYKGYHIPYARGILGQYIIVIPDKKAVIVRLGKKRSQNKKNHPSDLYEYIDFALKILK
jgi:CubicO group peptidase (beta-lactamase class C family)